MSTEQRDDTFLIAITITGQPTRAKARAALYQHLIGLNVSRATDSWWDAGPDSVDGHDNGEAVWVHPGRAIEAQRALVALGYAPEADMAIGPHPSVYVARNQNDRHGEVMGFICDRCNNGSDHPAVLAEVPCIDLDKWEHSHYWVDDTGILDGESDTITCLSDCGMTIVNGQAVGAVSSEHAGMAPDTDEPSPF